MKLYRYETKNEVMFYKVFKTDKDWCAFRSNEKGNGAWLGWRDTEELALGLIPETATLVFDREKEDYNSSKCNKTKSEIIKIWAEIEQKEIIDYPMQND